MIKSVDLLDSLIKRYNNNSLNSKKLYYSYSEKEKYTGSIDLIIELGTKPENARIFKQLVTKFDIDLETSKERLYQMTLDRIMYAMYNKMEEENFF